MKDHDKLNFKAKLAALYLKFQNFYNKPSVKTVATFAAMALVVIVGRTFDPFWYDEYEYPKSMMEDLK